MSSPLVILTEQASCLSPSPEYSYSHVVYLNVYPLLQLLPKVKYSVHMPFSLEGVQGSSSLTQFFPKAKDRGKQRGGMLGGGLVREKGIRTRMKEEAVKEERYKVARSSDKRGTQGALRSEDRSKGSRRTGVRLYVAVERMHKFPHLQKALWGRDRTLETD